MRALFFTLLVFFWVNEQERPAGVMMAPNSAIDFAGGAVSAVPKLELLALAVPSYQVVPLTV